LTSSNDGSICLWDVSDFLDIDALFWITSSVDTEMHFYCSYLALGFPEFIYYCEWPKLLHWKLVRFSINTNFLCVDLILILLFILYKLSITHVNFLCSMCFENFNDGCRQQWHRVVPCTRPMNFQRAGIKLFKSIISSFLLTRFSVRFLLNLVAKQIIHHYHSCYQTLYFPTIYL
jgi:hypothetical protein